MAKYGYETQWVKLTPALALAWLETMGDTNRDVTQSVIDDYAAQMKNGLWRRAPIAFAFHRDGRMVDGQHRCWAVVESKVELDVFVASGLTDEDVLALDRGKPRSYRDVAHYQGWNGDPLSASIAKILVLTIGQHTSRIPPAVCQTWYARYQDSIDFAIALRNGSRPSRGNSITLPMAAAFARAHAAGLDPALLTRMGEILKTGQVEATADNAAHVLRDAWMQKRLGVNSTDQYFKTEAAIRAFTDRRSIRTLQRPQAELFAIKAVPFAERYTVSRTHASPRSGKVARRKFAEANEQA